MSTILITGFLSDEFFNWSVGPQGNVPSNLKKLFILQGPRNVFEPDADKTKSPTMPVAAQTALFCKFLNCVLNVNIFKKSKNAAS